MVFFVIWLILFILTYGLLRLANHMYQSDWTVGNRYFALVLCFLNPLGFCIALIILSGVITEYLYNSVYFNTKSKW